MFIEDTELAEKLRKANRVFKRTLRNYLNSACFEDKEYYAALLDEQVAFFCQEFDVSPTLLSYYL